MELIKKLYNVAITTTIVVVAVLDTATAAREMELNKKIYSCY